MERDGYVEVIFCLSELVEKEEVLDTRSISVLTEIGDVRSRASSDREEDETEEEDDDCWSREATSVDETSFGSRVASGNDEILDEKADSLEEDSRETRLRGGDESLE